MLRSRHDRNLSSLVQSGGQELLDRCLRHDHGRMRRQQHLAGVVILLALEGLDVRDLRQGDGDMLLPALEAVRIRLCDPAAESRTLCRAGERRASSHRWLWCGWYAYQANVDETSGADAGYSPHHRLYASLQSQWGRTFVNLQGLYVGDRARVAEDARAEAPEYGQLDLLVRHELTRRVSLQLDVRNLLNANLLEASPGTSLPQDLPLAGRLYYAALERRF